MKVDMCTIRSNGMMVVDGKWIDGHAVDVTLRTESEEEAAEVLKLIEGGKRLRLVEKE